MARDELEERLESIFGNVNNWLKFAEAKNAALLTFDLAVIFGFYRLSDAYKPIPDLAWYCLLLSTALILISVLIILSSFFAKTKIPQFMVTRSPDGARRNLAFFGDLADVKSAELLDELKKSATHQSLHDHHRDLAAQIVVNSKITRKKYALFNAAVWFTVSAIITPVGALLFYWGLCDEAI